MKEGFREVAGLIESYEREMVETMGEMIGIRSISPASGGEGESARADFLEKKLKEWGFGTKRYDYPDETGTVRSNVISTMGKAGNTVWIISHIDTVSEGDRSFWRTDPFKLTVDGKRMYGRGASDDGQGVISSMFAMRALKESGAALKYNMGIALVANEELGSKYGMRNLMQEKIFGKDDIYVVPDWGNGVGDKIQIAEKGVLWLKITILGKEVHASTPDKGVNAYRSSIKLLNKIDELLHMKYSASDSIFEPSISTFEMTKHEKNVDSVNIIPGTEVCYLDCRVLPEYDLDSIIADIRGIADKRDFSDVKISIEEFNRTDPRPQTRETADVVRMLKDALLDLRGVNAKAIGIGGGTCAAYLREKGLPVAVWATWQPVAHEPNEYAIIDDMVDDAKVFAYLLI